MKRVLLTISIASLSFLQIARADDLESLAGKWSIKKTNDQGQNVIQTIEVKKDKFVFEILSSDESVVLHAEGDFKLEKLGPFSVARFSHIRAGGSASNMDDVDDTYTSVYTLDEDSWTLATNFDKQRDGQKPSADVYHHVKAKAASKETK